MLYKALDANLKSQWDHHCGWLTGPWVVDEWRDVDTEMWQDSLGHTLKTIRGGFACSDDILWCMMPEFCRYIAAVEVDGAATIIGKAQYHARMRVTSIKAWPQSKACLVLSWCEGRAHDAWASWFPTEAGLYDAANYQSQFQEMLEIAEPLWRSLFLNNETIPEHSLHRFKDTHKLIPEYTAGQEQIIRLAYMLALALTNNITIYGGNLAQVAESVRPGSWELIRGFTADHWSSLPEYEP